MSLTKDEREEVLSTVHMEMSHMFEVLENVYHRPEDAGKALLMQHIAKSVTAGWEGLTLPAE